MRVWEVSDPVVGLTHELSAYRDRDLAMVGHMLHNIGAGAKCRMLAYATNDEERGYGALTIVYDKDGTHHFALSSFRMDDDGNEITCLTRGWVWKHGDERRVPKQVIQLAAEIIVNYMRNDGKKRGE